MKSGEVSIHNARAGVSSQFTVFPTVTRPLFGPLRNNPNDAYLLVDPPRHSTRLVCHSSTDHSLVMGVSIQYCTALYEYILTVA
jgi:hypothetical protein